MFRFRQVGGTGTAETSGILYSITETAKANGLKPYEYFKFLFNQLLENEGKITPELVKDLMPWSENFLKKFV